MNFSAANPQPIFKPTNQVPPQPPAIGQSVQYNTKPQSEPYRQQFQSNIGKFKFPVDFPHNAVVLVPKHNIVTMIIPREKVKDFENEQGKENLE